MEDTTLILLANRRLELTGLLLLPVTGPRSCFFEVHVSSPSFKNTLARSTKSMGGGFQLPADEVTVRSDLATQTSESARPLVIEETTVDLKNGCAVECGG